MNNKTIAIIGAGPAGLVLAKEALELGMTPVIYEQETGLGGVWNPETGKTWNGMRTNLSYFHMGFSDHPWPQDTPDFPLHTDVQRYLQSYTRQYRLEPHIRYEQKVGGISFTGQNWMLETSGTAAKEKFDCLGFTNGIFNHPVLPAFLNKASFSGIVLHSGQYKNAADFRGKKITVIGDSFSAYEICADLADHGIPSTQILKKGAWVLPRHVNKNGRKVPMDLTSYLHNRITKPEPSAQQRNTARMLYFSENFGNPGTIDEALRPSDDPARTPIAVISDTYLDHAKNGMITPFRQNVSCATSRTLALESGDKIDTDVLIACTGFSANIPCDDALSHVLSYRSDDLMQPLLLNNGTLHHQLPGAAFVGMYRGPFFGVMEMQARWSMGVASGLITAPSLAESIEGIRYENDIRHTAPRPQFPRADYVGYMHALATRIGCVPCDLLEETQENDKVPMIPADFRRAGFGANKTIASLQRNRMIERLTV